MNQTFEKVPLKLVPESSFSKIITESWKENFLRLSRSNLGLNPNKWNNFFKGKTFFLTGSFRRINQDNINSLLMECGGLVAPAFDPKINYLLVGEVPDIAICSKAQKLGIFMLEENLFIKFVLYKAIRQIEQEVLELLYRIRKSVYPELPPKLPALDSLNFLKKIQSLVYNKEFVFLGKLSILEKSECSLLVKYFGGKVNEDISTFTEYIVVGDMPAGAQLPVLNLLSFASFIYEEKFLDIFSNPGYRTDNGKTYFVSFPSLPYEISYCITGEFSRFSREDMKFLLSKLGWIEEIASPSTQVFIIGDNPDMAILAVRKKSAQCVFGEAAFISKFCSNLLSENLSKAIGEHQS